MCSQGVPNLVAAPVRSRPYRVACTILFALVFSFGLFAFESSNHACGSFGDCHAGAYAFTQVFSVCVYIHIFIQIHTYLMNAHAYVHTCISICCVYVYTYVNKIKKYAYMYISTISIYIYIYIYVCLFVYCLFCRYRFPIRRPNPPSSTLRPTAGPPPPRPLPHASVRSLPHEP